MSVDSSRSPAPQVTDRQAAESEWSAGPLRPVAHWVVLPDEQGHNALTCIWEVPNPVPPA